MRRGTSCGEEDLSLPCHSCLLHIAWRFMVDFIHSVTGQQQPVYYQVIHGLTQVTV